MESYNLKRIAIEICNVVVKYKLPLMLLDEVFTMAKQAATENGALVHQEDFQFGNRLISIDLPDFNQEAKNQSPPVYTKTLPLDRRKGYPFLDDIKEKCNNTGKCEMNLELAYQLEKYRLAFHELSIKAIRLRYALTVASVVIFVFAIVLTVVHLS